MSFEWTIFERDQQCVVVPRSPTMMKLRRVISEEFFDQAALKPLKRFMEGVFLAGPALVLLALYLPGGQLLAIASVICLCVAAPYWFAPHFLCRLFLERQGFEQREIVIAEDYGAALAQA